MKKRIYNEKASYMLRIFVCLIVLMMFVGMMPGTVTALTDETSSGSADAIAEISMPSQHFTGRSSNGVSVVADAAEGAFPSGTIMKLKAVASCDAMKKAQRAVKSKIVDVEAVDITFYDKNGKEIQPSNDAKVHVSLTCSSKVDGTKHEVIHFGNDGTKKIAEASATKASFDATSFSIYAIIGQPGGKAVITYEFYNDASAPALIATRIVKDGDTLKSPGTPVSVTDSTATFAGWSTSSEPTTYQKFGAVTILDTVTADETVKLYARFHKTYHITFHNQYNMVLQKLTAEGGSDFHIADYNSDVNFPAPAGKAVVGWSTIKAAASETGSSLGDDRGELTDINNIKSDVDLYPIIKSAYWITYVSNEGSYKAPEFFLLGKDTRAPSEPTRAGYTFMGWYTDEALTNKFDFGSVLTSDIKLYAKWQANDNIPYKVAYWTENADNSDYSLLQVDTLYGTVDTSSLAPPDPSGMTMDSNLYTLNGTITQKTINGNGSTLVNIYYNRTIKHIYFYTAASRFTSNPVEIPSLRITAKWGADISGLWPSTVDSDTYDSNWYTSSNGSIGQCGISTMPAADTGFWEMTKSIGKVYKFYHYLEQISMQTSTVTYDGKYFATDPIMDVFSSNPETVWYSTPEDHYDILGFTYMDNIIYTNGSASFNADGTLPFYYSRNSYNINYFSNGSLIKQTSRQYQTDLSGNDYTPDSSLSPVSGYVFSGWYNNSQLAGSPVILSGIMPAHDITLYAKWKAPEYTVHFDINGGTSSTTLDQTDMYDKLVTKPENPTKKGYTFMGWTLNGKAFDFGETYISGDVLDTAVNGVITLKANWLGNEKVKVEYDAKGGTNAPADLNLYYSSANATVKRASTPPSGKYFLYWEHDGKKYYPGCTINLNVVKAVNGIITLDAVYGKAPSLTSITYHSNGGAGKNYTTNSVRNNAKSTILKSSDPRTNYYRNGYRFVGWNTKADGSGTSYSAGDVVRIDNIGGNDLYAQWVEFSAAKGKNINMLASKPADIPDTGDLAPVYLLMWIMLTSVAALICIAVIGKRRKMNE